MRCLRPGATVAVAGTADEPYSRRQEVFEGDLAMTSAAAAAARATAAWRLFHGNEAKEQTVVRKPAARLSVQAPPSPELGTRLSQAMTQRAKAAMEDHARLPAPVPSGPPRVQPGMLSARGVDSRVSTAPTSPDRSALQAPYATESPEEMKALAARRRSTDYRTECIRLHGGLPGGGSESLSSLSTQSTQAPAMLIIGSELSERRKSIVEPEPQCGASARQEKTYSSRQRQQQPRQATLPPRRRSQPVPAEPPFQGYKRREDEVDKTKPVVVVSSEKGITKVANEAEYSQLAQQAPIYRARSLLPTLSERPPLTEAGYQTNVPANRAEPARPWEPKLDVDGKTQVPESIFKAMEKLGHAARHRGQHILAKSNRHRGRKTLVRHDCLQGRSSSTEYLNAAAAAVDKGGWEQTSARAEPTRQPAKMMSNFERRNPSSTTWRSVLSTAKDSMLRSY